MRAHPASLVPPERLVMPPVVAAGTSMQRICRRLKGVILQSSKKHPACTRHWATTETVAAGPGSLDPLRSVLAALAVIGYTPLSPVQRHGFVGSGGQHQHHWQCGALDRWDRTSHLISRSQMLYISSFILPSLIYHFCVQRTMCPDYF